ncbi:DUF6624 domain-containing protein [Phenylobacterium terrae]|uniref:DUF6624 domain-containing protein n=1 Tax=Phenylobacterium terrae TaxID=2665495 RepID=A0ABW4N4H5_9CAUL
MLIAVLFAAALMLAPAPASTEGRALVARMEQELAAVRARHAQAPPKDDVERLQRLGELDQVLRQIVVHAEFSAIPEADRVAAREAAGALIDSVDRENQAALVAMLPPEGWFYESRYGRPAAQAAFHVVQHADTELQRRFLPILAELVPKGEVEGQSYALMYDRVAMAEGRPQRYGSQFRCEDGRWTVYRIEDPAQLDALRQTMGLGPFAEMKAQVDKLPPCLEPARR